MPRTNSPLHGYCHSDTTHRKSDQTDRYTQITGKIESIESDVEIQEISCPDQQGLNNEKTFTLHQPDALHSIPDVLQHRLCFLDQRKVTHICEYKPNSGNKNYTGHVNPYRVEHRLEAIQQRRVLRKEAAEEINKIFFEVIIAPDYDVDALEILGQKKNRIILVRKEAKLPKKQFRALLNGVLVQDKDTNIETVADLKTVTDKAPTPEEVEDMLFANKIVKNSKSNAIVLAKGKQLLASGVGQTSRVDALKQAIEKAKSFGFDLNGAVMASDAFFPFPDCVEIADKEGITAVIQPGGSVKDDLSFAYCNEHGMAMVTTGIRHFKH